MRFDVGQFLVGNETIGVVVVGFRRRVFNPILGPKLPDLDGAEDMGILFNAW
jgi:hypothetical protein